MFSLLSLLDDIASTLDDVAVMSKIAVKKTSALMSDDLAVNAGVIDGVHAKRELPIVWKIFLGSLINKVYCIVGVMLLTSFYPPALKVILFIGGIYLAYEGAHKVWEKVTSSKNKEESKPEVTEQQRIKGAVRTDLILSIEIMVIAQSSMSGSILNQLLSLIVVGFLASVIIYGLVAFLVKIDDFGLSLISKGYKKVGLALVNLMPKLMKGLGIIGIVAMFLVAGGIFSHTFHLAHYAPELIQNLTLGLIGGFIVLWPINKITAIIGK